MIFLYVSIGGFNIRLSFDKNELPDPSLKYVSHKLKKEIFDYLKSFVLKQKPDKIDFELIFRDEHNPQILEAKGKDESYITLSRKISVDKVETYYYISLAQFQKLLMGIINTLLDKNEGFILHSSASKVAHGAFMFLGKSGAGKSTIVKMMNKKFPALTDDGTILRKIKSRYYLYQTPFVEKAWWIKKNSAPQAVLKIFFLNKAKEFKVKKLIPKENIIEKLFSQTIRIDSKSNKDFERILLFTNRFENFYELYFAKNANKSIRLITENLK